MPRKSKLVPIILKEAFGLNNRGEVAGFKPEVAQALVNNKKALAYDDDNDEHRKLAGKLPKAEEEVAVPKAANRQGAPSIEK